MRTIVFVYVVLYRSSDHLYESKSFLGQSAECYISDEFEKQAIEIPRVIKHSEGTFNSGLISFGRVANFARDHRKSIFGKSSLAKALSISNIPFCSNGYAVDSVC